MHETHNPNYKHTTHYVTNLNISKFAPYHHYSIKLKKNVNNKYFDILIHTTFKPSMV